MKATERCWHRTRRYRGLLVGALTLGFVLTYSAPAAPSREPLAPLVWWGGGPVPGSPLSIQYLAAVLTHLLLVSWVMTRHVGHLPLMWKSSIVRHGRFIKWYGATVFKVAVICLSFWMLVAVVIGAVAAVTAPTEATAGVLAGFSDTGAGPVALRFAAVSSLQSMVYVQMFILCESLGLASHRTGVILLPLILVLGYGNLYAHGALPFGLGTLSLAKASSMPDGGALLTIAWALIFAISNIRWTLRRDLAWASQ